MADNVKAKTKKEEISKVDKKEENQTKAVEEAVEKEEIKEEKVEEIKEEEKTEESPEKTDETSEVEKVVEEEATEAEPEKAEESEEIKEENEEKTEEVAGNVVEEKVEVIEDQIEDTKPEEAEEAPVDNAEKDAIPEGTQEEKKIEEITKKVVEEDVKVEVEEEVEEKLEEVKEQSEPETPEPEVKKEEKKKKVAKKKKDVKTEEMTSLENQIKMYEETMETVRSGNIVEGNIIRVDQTEVLIDIGFKAEGIVPISEFGEDVEINVGDKVSVYIVNREGRNGRPYLSKKRADIQKTWRELEEKSKTNEVITGRVAKRVKGGLIVDVNGINTFLPASQVSTKTLPNLDHFVGKELDFRIINYNREKENIVISRKIVIEKEVEKQKEDLMKKLQIDAEIDGVVKNIMEYGVFVDLGGIDGLLHISDMSWGHITHPSEMLNIGDKIKVKVLDFNKDSEKVSLGLKQLVPHPWKNIEIKYPEGSKVEGKVTNLTNYGAFVELEKGVEGLIHVSEMSWTKQITHPKQMLKVGDAVNAIVLNVDKEEHRISLGLKQVEPNPWLTIGVTHPVESTVTGKIKNITNFGAFMEVEKDIDGLIHISDLSWTKRIMHPSEMLKKGQEVTAVVLSIDKVMQRIALGLKQLQEDPWEKIEERFPINSEHEIEVIKIIPKGALVLADKDSGIEGFIPTSHLGIPGLEEPEFAFDPQEVIPVKVIEADKENRRLIFSVKTYFFGREEDEVNKFVQDHLEKIKDRRRQKDEKAAQKKAAKEAAEKAAREAKEKAAKEKEAAEKESKEVAEKAADEKETVEKESKEVVEKAVKEDDSSEK